MSALERTFEWRRVIGPRTLVPSVIFNYAVTYDLRDLWLTQVIRDVIGDDPEVRGRKIVFHSKVLTKTDILVYYMSQSVQKQQRCGLKCRSRVPSDAKTRNLRNDGDWRSSHLYTVHLVADFGWRFTRVSVFLYVSTSSRYMATWSY